MCGEGGGEKNKETIINIILIKFFLRFHRTFWPGNFHQFRKWCANTISLLNIQILIDLNSKFKPSVSRQYKHKLKLWSTKGLYRNHWLQLMNFKTWRLEWLKKKIPSLSPISTSAPRSKSICALINRPWIAVMCKGVRLKPIFTIFINCYVTQCKYICIPVFSLKIYICISFYKKSQTMFSLTHTKFRTKR